MVEFESVSQRWFSDVEKATTATTCQKPQSLVRFAGSGFDGDTSILWDGSPLATTLVSADTVSAVVNSNALAASGLYPVSLASKLVPSITASPVNVAVYNPIPMLGAASPETIQWATGDAALVVTGSSFVDGARIFFDGQAVPTQYQDSACF